MSPALPSISSDISRIAPGFRALSIVVEAAAVRAPEAGSEALRAACAAVLASEPSWGDAHLAAWGRVFQAFGAKPKRTPCSAEALRKRVLRDGTMASLDPVVDLYNAVSLRYAIPVGGENLAAYAGAPRLCLADGSETFDTVKEGEPALETVEAGEAIWRDDIGVTCRRWNWRQGVRTRLSAADANMWFILESLPEMPLDALYAAASMLTDGLEKMMPGAKIEMARIDAL